MKQAQLLYTPPVLNQPVETEAGADPLWYKDAIIYQLHVKAFFDSNNDRASNEVAKASS